MGLVVRPQETGVRLRFNKVALIAGAAEADIRIHVLYAAGITTVAANYAAAVAPNLDDAKR